jgi:hypothetical protein
VLHGDSGGARLHNRQESPDRWSNPPVSNCDLGGRTALRGRRRRGVVQVPEQDQPTVPAVPAQHGGGENPHRRRRPPGTPRTHRIRPAGGPQRRGAPAGRVSSIFDFRCTMTRSQSIGPTVTRSRTAARPIRRAGVGGGVAKLNRPKPRREAGHLRRRHGAGWSNPPRQKDRQAAPICAGRWDDRRGGRGWPVARRVDVLACLLLLGRRFARTSVTDRITDCGSRIDQICRAARSR